MDTLITLHPRKWRNFGFLFFVAVLLLLASTGNAAAQDALPPTDTTVTNNLIAVQWAVIGVLIVGMIVLFLYFSDKLYKALPPETADVVRASQKAALDFAVKFLEHKKTEAAANDVAWDDPMWVVILDEAKKRRESLNAPPTAPQ